MICKVCGKLIKAKNAESRHVKIHGYKTLVEYYVAHEGLIVPKCKCGKFAKVNHGIIFYKSCGNSECITVEMKDRKHSESCKKRMSDGMKLAHKEGRAKGWSFINSDESHRSYPEKWFVKNILKKHALYERYTVKEKFSFGKYFLDFAFLELKLDVELDGSQHFRNEKNMEFDRKRDEFMESNGWTVYRIAWMEITKDRNKPISDFLTWLDELKTSGRRYDAASLLHELKNKNQPKYGTRREYSETIKKRTNDRYQKIIQEIIDDGSIDFSKFGWVEKLSKKINMQPQRVNRIMKRTLPNFYEVSCFHRHRLGSSAD